jgi:hypothetical protein
LSRRVCILLIGVLSVAVAAGCGGESTEGKSPSTLSRAQFRKQAKALCDARRQKSLTEAFAARAKAEQAGDRPPQQIELEIMSRIVLPSVRKKLAEVRALGVPKGDRAEVDAILNATEKVISEAEAEPKRFLYEQVHFKHPFHHANELAKKYGISACAKA